MCVCTEDSCSCTCIEVKPPLHHKLPPYYSARPAQAGQLVAWIEKSTGVRATFKKLDSASKLVALTVRPDASDGLIPLALVLADIERQVNDKLIIAGMMPHNLSDGETLNISFHGLSPNELSALLTWLSGTPVSISPSLKASTDYEAEGITVEELLEAFARG